MHSTHKLQHFLKTRVRCITNHTFFKKPSRKSIRFKGFSLKPAGKTKKLADPKSSAGVENLSVLATSVEEHTAPRTPMQLRLARSHARTTRTRNETETDFPVGLSRCFFPPNLRYSCPLKPAANSNADVFEAVQLP